MLLQDNRDIRIICEYAGIALIKMLKQTIISTDLKKKKKKTEERRKSQQRTKKYKGGANGNYVTEKYNK